MAIGHSEVTWNVYSIVAQILRLYRRKVYDLVYVSAVEIFQTTAIGVSICRAGIAL